MMRAWTRALGLFASVVVISGTAQALEPFDNWANPAGLYGVVYPIHFSADEVMDNDGNVIVNNLDFSQTGVVFRGAYYQTEPFSYLLSLYAPVVQVKGRNPFTTQEEKTSGLGDITLVGGWFFIDDKPKNLYVALGMKIDFPTGAFDQNKLVANIGEGVWRFRPLLAVAKLAGKVDMEGLLVYKRETENSDTKLRDGDEVVWESYAGMFVNQQWMVGGHFNATFGQNDEFDGTEIQDSADKVFQAGPSVQFMINQRSNVLLEYLQDFGVKNTVKGSLILVRGAYKF